MSTKYELDCLVEEGKIVDVLFAMTPAVPVRAALPMVLPLLNAYFCSAYRPKLAW